MTIDDDVSRVLKDALQALGNPQNPQNPQSDPTQPQPIDDGNPHVQPDPDPNKRPQRAFPPIPNKTREPEGQPPEKQPTPEPQPEPDNNYANLPLWCRPGINSATFDLLAYLNSIPNLERLLKSPKGRVALTRSDPLLFALTYLPHHLKDKNNPANPPSFADCHFDWARQALLWAAKKHSDYKAQPSEDRVAEVAPRMCGKSTWWFLILPMWAGAHGHKEFVAAFASSAGQAEGHLMTFKKELEKNKYLREDFPNLCAPQRRLRGAVVADRGDQFNSESGFVFVAKGIDSSNLGMKVEEARPDLILLDDIEPDEANYTPELARKRLGTVTDAILPLNIYASVVFVGTVTMPNSIIHQLVKHARGLETEDWINDEKINPHYYAPIVETLNPLTNKTEQRSLWQDKWPLDYLISIKHTRSYAKNYANDPRGRDGDYWNEDDYTYGLHPAPYNTPQTKSGLRCAIFIDPPTTTTRTSDPAGIAIISWAPTPPYNRDSARDQRPHPDAKHMYHTGNGEQWYEMQAKVRHSATNRKTYTKTIYINPGTAVIHHASQVKLTGKKLARHIYQLIAAHPELNIRRIVLEATQGGDLWKEAFAEAPVPLEVIMPREGKEIRFDRALEYYQKRPTLVLHEPEANLTKLEEQQMGFPKAAFDDIADSAVSGILYFLEPKPRKQRVKGKARSYV